ncbi:hypothetical protein DEO72_LG2g4111 [Vigna unguiculata]|uniref:Uncharacterized protein n=1 Tax=Vigna unguiculata TaxID=3917 RepID=A0A4D6L5Q3_VIGUN|nr:hypothetical protein DEO72_LG2g4111 [Vigna unguiculata]
MCLQPSFLGFYVKRLAVVGDPPGDVAKGARVICITQISKHRLAKPGLPPGDTSLQWDNSSFIWGPIIQDACYLGNKSEIDYVKVYGCCVSKHGPGGGGLITKLYDWKTILVLSLGVLYDLRSLGICLCAKKPVTKRYWYGAWWRERVARRTEQKSVAMATIDVWRLAPSFLGFYVKRLAVVGDPPGDVAKGARVICITQISKHRLAKPGLPPGDTSLQWDNSSFIWGRALLSV